MFIYDDQYVPSFDLKEEGGDFLISPRSLRPQHSSAKRNSFIHTNTSTPTQKRLSSPTLNAAVGGGGCVLVSCACSCINESFFYSDEGCGGKLEVVRMCVCLCV